MKTVRRAMVVAVAASLLYVPLALAQANISDAEFKCQDKATKASTKFVSSKSKCITKCFQNHWKGLVPAADCYPPYGGATLTCIADPLKGAEAKFVLATQKICDPGFKATLECPACYDSGNGCGPGGYAGDYMQNIENQVDSFVPGVGCELSPPPTKEEQKCQTNTAKALVKQVGGVVKCYSKCMANARKGIGTHANCLPSGSDATLTACKNAVVAKAVASIDKLCIGKHVSPVDAIPDCSPGTDNYPDGANWTNLVDIAISGNIPANYCEDP